MNIKQIKEELEAFNSDIELENEVADKKSKARIYRKAYEALEELQDVLDEGMDPATGRLDKHTELFYDKITEMIDEIYSRSLAFEE